MHPRAFTLVELIAVMVVLSILASVAAPRFFNQADDARKVAFEGTVGGVQEGLRALLYAREVGASTGNITFNQYGVPNSLGDTVANELTLFDDVLESPLRQAAPGTIGIKYNAPLSTNSYDFYYWDANANDIFDIQINNRPDRFLVYIKEPIGNIYLPGTILVFQFD